MDSSGRALISLGRRAHISRTMPVCLPSSSASSPAGLAPSQSGKCGPRPHSEPTQLNQLYVSDQVGICDKIRDGDQSEGVVENMHACLSPIRPLPRPARAFCRSAWLRNPISSGAFERSRGWRCANDLSHTAYQGGKPTKSPKKGGKAQLAVRLQGGSKESRGPESGAATISRLCQATYIGSAMFTTLP